VFWGLPDASYVKLKRKQWSTFSTTASLPLGCDILLPTFSNNQIGAKGASSTSER